MYIKVQDNNFMILMQDLHDLKAGEMILWHGVLCLFSQNLLYMPAFNLNLMK